MEATQLARISAGMTNAWSQTVQRHFCFALGCRAIMQVYQGGHMNGFHVICTVLTFVCPAFHEMTGYDRNCPAHPSTPETRQNPSFSVNFWQPGTLQITLPQGANCPCKTCRKSNNRPCNPKSNLKLSEPVQNSPVSPTTKADPTGQWWTHVPAFGTKRSQVQILSPRPQKLVGLQ